MDLISLGFLILVLVASGFIAFWADRLGKKLGKKRISYRGIRPKHVAAIATVVMGVGVSFLTILFVAAVSSDARTWLREGSQLLVQREQLRKDNVALEAKNEGLAHDSERLTQANKDLEKSNSNLERGSIDLKKSLASERQKLAEAQSQRARLIVEAARLVSEKESLSREANSLKARLDQNRKELSASRASLENSRKALANLKKTLLALQEQVRTTQLNFGTSKQNVVTANERLDSALKKSFELYKESIRLQTEVTAGEERVFELDAERKKAESDLQTAQSALTMAQARLDRAGQDLDQLLAYAQEQRLFLNDSYRVARSESMTFRKGEEVTRLVVTGGSDATRAATALTTLLRTARIEAQARGAKSHRMDGKVFEVADIFDRLDPKSNSAISADVLKRSVVTAVAGRVEDQVLIATSSLNAFVGEVVSLEVSVMPNPVIYHRGDLLSEARIDGSLSEDRIFAQISDFLRTRLRERAVQDRMIPRAGTETPFGEIPILDVLNLVRDSKRVGRNVRVQAFAAKDIHAADALQLEFRLR